MNDSISKNVARLGGYLAGLTSIDGNIRSYSAFAYLIKHDDRSFDDALSHFYSAQVELSFAYVSLLTNGLRDLESEVRDFILRDAFFLSHKEKRMNSDKALIDRKKYISFRVMELISQVIEYSKNRKVYKAEKSLNNPGSRIVYYGVLSDQFYLVIQFNDDSNHAGQEDRGQV